MSDDKTTGIPPQTFVECGMCKGNVEVISFCKNCLASLCNVCACVHSASHVIVPRTYSVLRLYGPKKIAEQCRIHPEKEISCYCNDCNIPCCISCLVENHNRHDMSKIEEKYLNAERSLNDYVSRLNTNVRTKLIRMEEEVRVNVELDKSHVEKFIKDINDFRQEVVQDFNKECDSLIFQVQEISHKNNEGVRKIEKAKENLESLNQEIEEKLQKGHLDLMSYIPPKLESLVPTLRGPKITIPSFEPAMKVLEVIRESVGKIHYKEIDNTEKYGASSMRPINIQKIHSFESMIRVTSLTKAGDNMIWVTYRGSNTMYQYNDMGNEVRSVSVEGCKGINDMTITQPGEIIITCVDKKVRCVSLSGNVSTLIDTTPFGCHGVCLTEQGDIVVCMSGQHERNHVAVYSNDGRRKLHELRGEDSQRKCLITDPYCVVQNGRDLCVVNEYRDVLCVDDRGTVRWVYDSRQAKLGESFKPCGICVDKYHNLLVTDYNNHCVHYIDRKGRLIQVILTQKQTGLQYHHGICVDDVNEHVWVGNYPGNVVISMYLA